LLLHDDLERAAFQADVYPGFPPEVLDQIREGLADFTTIRATTSSRFRLSPIARIRSLISSQDDAVERDRLVWEALDRSTRAGPVVFEHAFGAAETTKERVSALLAMHHASHRDAQRATSFLEEISEGHDVEVAEWATMLLQESVATATGDAGRLAEPVSTREFVHRPDRRFDLTMPLLFSGVAYTRIGGVTKKTVLSPLWFERVLGEAMVCLRADTYRTQLVLEKRVGGLHADGSPHYEIFPFAGTTEDRAPGVYLHRYWANLRRPYYPSGRTEQIDRGEAVVTGMPMTFARIAETSAPRRYWLDGQPLAETVRGQFFGYGHIEPGTLLKNRLAMGPGNFQLTPKIHPVSGKPSNTRFYGTFYGKIDDFDGDGRLDMNARPPHCLADGRLDYLGDGTLARDPVRPDDWT
jgi:hypothetical protein